MPFPSPHLRYLFKRIQAGESLNSANMQMYKTFVRSFRSWQSA